MIAMNINVIFYIYRRIIVSIVHDFIFYFCIKKIPGISKLDIGLEIYSRIYIYIVIHE